MTDIATRAGATPAGGTRPARAAADSENALMTRRGITRVPADHYLVDGFRYTRLADALAQAARRDGSRGDGK